MRHYELMVILDPNVDERTVAPTLDTFLNVIRANGGNVEKVDVWGKRRLSFEIAKKYEGIYAVVQLSSAPDAVKELDRQLSLQETVLRTKVLRRDVARIAKSAAKAAAKAAQAAKRSTAKAS